MSLVADERRLQEHTVGQLVLDTQAVLRGPGNHKVRINCAQAKDRRNSRRPGRGIRQIGIRERDRLQVRYNSGLAEDDVAFWLIVKNTETAAKDRLVVAERGERESKARSEEVLRLVKSAL